MTPESLNSLDLLKNQVGFGALGSLRSVAKGLTQETKIGTGPSGVTDAEKKRWKASLDFEAMFLGQMYKAMRATATSAGNELTEASPGREIFTEMLDNQYAGMHAKSPLESGDQGLKNAISGLSNGMAAQIYRSLSRQEGDVLPTPAAAKFFGPSIRNGSVPQAARISSENLNPIVDLASKTYGVAAALIKSVIKIESANQPLAVSKAGAKGLMQLMDSTASDLGVRNVFNVRENILAGTRYLGQLLERFKGDESKALAAYNAGPATVERYGGIPPYQETKDYVTKVLKSKSEFEATATGRARTERLP